MKTKEQSINLTIALIISLTVAFAILIFAAPVIAPWYGDLSGKGEVGAKVLLAVFYICSPAAGTVIVSGLKLLFNLKKGEFFTKENTLYIRRMSISCLGVVAPCTFGCFWFYGFIPITVSALFMFLILRIVKNIFQYATELKEENDLVV